MILENSLVKAEVLPERGGKISSLFYKPLSRELLYHTEGCYDSPLPVYGQTFGPFDAWGFDEMFPTITAEAGMPDHGEIWALPWRFENDGSVISGSVDGRVFPYRFSRSLSLTDTGIHLEYSAENLSDEVFSCLWTSHMLLDMKAGIKLRVPEGMNRIINALDGKMGKPGDILPFPGAWRLDVIPVQNSSGMQKYYFADRVPEGWCSLESDDLSVRLSWPEEKVPWLGIWVNEGGWSGHYNIGLEPATGGMDCPSLAEKYHQSWILGPREIKKWFLNVDLQEPL